MNGTIPYAPTTENGAGLFPPLLRAMSRVIALLFAHTSKWPITIEQAKFELADADAAITTNLIDNYELLSLPAKANLSIWCSNLATVHQTAVDLCEANPDAPIDGLVADLRELAKRTFAITSILDTDLCGLKAPATDPGRTP